MTDGSDVVVVHWDDEHQIARVEWAPGSVCGEPEARLTTELLRSLGRGRIPLLVDMRGMAKFDRPAREHFRSDDGTSAIALLAGSPVNKMLANFFIGLSKGSPQVRMFTDEAAAVRWLQERPA